MLKGSMFTSMYAHGHTCVSVLSFLNICDAESLVSSDSPQFWGRPSFYDLNKGVSTRLAVWVVTFNTVGRVLEQRFQILGSQKTML